jgi:PncC family amidohydrolase
MLVVRVETVHDLLELLKARGLSLAVAEGDTGGLLLASLIAEPGSSAVVIGGVVAYADALKCELLEVPAEVLREHGAVSAVAVEAMARGVRRVAHADVGLATTGIAGPGGATPTKPVGLAFVAVATADGSSVREYHWTGDRAANQHASAAAALALLREIVTQEAGIVSH